MNFSQEIISVLDYLCRKFGIAIDWTSDNVMPYLQDLSGRYIQYEIYTGIAWCIAPVVVLVVAGLIWLLASTIGKNSRSDIAEISKCVFFAALIFGALICMHQAIDIIECYTLPEKVILEYLNSLVNSASGR